MDSLFPSNWRERVRELLAPFQKEPTLDEERRGEWLCYRVETRELLEPERADTHGVFLLGDAVLHYVYHSEGEAGSSELVWARKSDFVSPLHFWAAAITLRLSSDTGFSDPWFDFRILPQSQFFEPKTSFTLNEQIMHYHPAGESIAGVPIMEEVVVRGWGLNSKWNDVDYLFETPSSFCWWNWHTGA